MGGSQNERLTSSKLCRQRKRLSIELLAAIANIRVFGIDPSQCTYFSGVTTTNFPASLLADARAAAAGESVNDIVAATALLRKFNSSGRTNDFPVDLVECSPSSTASLRKESRDPTLQATCPGLNDSCASAETILFKPSTGGLFPRATASRQVSLAKFNDDLPSPSCGSGGAEAVWKINPDVGKASRQFTVDTFGSSFDTLLSVFSASTAPLCSNLVEVVCSDDTTNNVQSQVRFSTDGTSTYFIIVEGKNGDLGKAKLRITSP